MLILRDYPPTAALAPYIGRYYTLAFSLPANFDLIDLLLPEFAFISIVQRGDWAIEGEDGLWNSFDEGMFCGPSSRPARVRMRGQVNIVGVSFRPGGWRALFRRPASAFADRRLPFPAIWGGMAEGLKEAIADLRENQDIFRVIEAEIQRRLKSVGSWQVDPEMQAFEKIARTGSTRQVKDVAAELGLSARQFERHCLHNFGFPPKLVLRRSRFLDMASVLRGLSDPSGEELAELRYFDQSHRNREFRRFIGMTPQQFAQAETPLLTASLRSRFESLSGARTEA